jgi:hypothetical protein
MDIMTLEEVERKIVTIRDVQVLVDRDVAELYAVETRDINKAVKNNPDKFPDGYVFELSRDEFEYLRGKFSTAKFSKTRALPKAFSEKGLYMIATILKGQRATQTTIAIVETFTKIRHLSRSVKELSVVQDKNDQKALMQKSGELIAEILDDDLAVTDSETSIELNFAVLKFKHTVKKKKP